MPTRENHLRQARANLSALELQPADLYTWRVTIRFYVVLHLIDAVFAEVGHTHPDSHEERGRMIREKRFALPYLIQQAYRQLEQESREARYDCPSLGRLERLESTSSENLAEIFEALKERLGL
jgi:hypothetical protein